MDYVPYAVPFFLLLILAEIGWGLWRKHTTYRVNDSINSLSLGMLSTLSKLVFLNVGLLVFTRMGEEGLGWQWDSGSALNWLAGIFLYDFCYYWFHRISHERTFFWGSHVVHHQSEDFNLSTALRQTSTGIFTSWIFYLPLFLMGMPIEMYVSIASLHLIYQFWIHTQFVPKLGPLEWFLITPSNHRVHHAQNPRYVDRNYGGLLCVWDRLFGTFSEESEDEKIIYGITTPLRSWNPLWANLHVFATMLRDARHTRGLVNKMKVWTGRTGWRPADARERFPDIKCDLTRFQKYDPPLSPQTRFSMVLHYLLVTVLYFWTVSQVQHVAAPVLLWAMLAATLALISIGMSADQSLHFPAFELGRAVLLSASLVLLQALAYLDGVLLGGAWAFSVASAVLGWLAASASKPAPLMEERT